ncbi:Uncharacterised protein [Shewanella algae]|uniref:Uncharacterized protein n=1 Tax=Shewanella algae TaxID=38313 RepID=A0A380BGU4_9GAMM|nr:Uncharacterised protein [Shewanella algae]
MNIGQDARVNFVQMATPNYLPTLAKTILLQWVLLVSHSIIHGKKQKLNVIEC